ncbi:MAG: CotH kinase family protein [Planctomycetota bacterium]|nr:CotH kinase family protein [Planctomycetota bacterium]
MLSNLLLLALAPLSAASQQGPVVSEFLASNQGSLEDEDGDSPDWIEIYNPRPTAVDLGGNFLTDDSGNLTRWAFPSPTILAAQSTMIVFASGKDRAVSGQELHTDFSLSAGGEYLGFVESDGVTIRNHFAPEYPSQYANVSFGLRFDPGLTAEQTYFPTPTPNVINGAGGPFIESVSHSPTSPSNHQDIVVTARILSADSPVTNATLTTRVMYAAETTVIMNDSGIAPDQQAGDGIWTGQISAASSSPGEMVRWKVSAIDNGNHLTISPAHLTNESAEYFGTVVDDPAIDSDLATLHWFVENPNLAETSTGTRCSVWLNGEFYDNQFCRIRGGSTASYQKKSYKIDFNPGEKFRMIPGVDRMEEINLNSTWSDKSYIRQQLSWETYANVGASASLAEMVHLMQNGNFKGLYNFIEQVDDEFLDRRGFDEGGALYKMYNSMTSSINGVEKKTRTWEGNQDLLDLVNGVQLQSANLERFLFDNIDLPAVISYLVGTTLICDNDHIDKNYYLYRDSDGDQEWMFFPWDKDLTLGRNYTLTGGVLNDSMWANIDPQCHPKYGDRNHKKIDGYWNRLIDACYRDPRVFEMYARRLWSVMEQELQAPGTPAAQLKFEQRVEELRLLLADEVAQDVQVWGSPSWGSYMNFQSALNQLTQDYLVPRRVHLFQTHAQSGVLPGPPTTTPTMVFGSMEPDPSSGDDDEEWLQLLNPTNDAVDMSGWTLTGGIDFTFAPGTVVPANDEVYLSAKIQAFRARNISPKGNEGNFVVGPHDGNLRVGEELFLWNADGALVTSNSDAFALFASDLIAGTQATVSVAGATPNSPVFIGWSSTGGGPTTTAWGIADLSPPIQVLPTLTASTAGTASTSAAIPANLAGVQVWLQALDSASGDISNGETRVIQ